MCEGKSAAGNSSTTTTTTQGLDLASLIQGITVPGAGAQQAAAAPRRQQQKPVALHDLLTPNHTLPALENSDEEIIDALISNLPPALIPTNASLAQKKAVIARVLQSPQFVQGCAGLTAALREGALRSVADSLRVPIEAGAENTGDPVVVFVEGVKKMVEKKK